MKVLKEKADLQSNRVYHLEDTMIMYGKYNSDTLMNLIDTVHHMQNLASWKEQIFVIKMTGWIKKELIKFKFEFAYAVDTVLFFDNCKGKIRQNV